MLKINSINKTNSLKQLPSLEKSTKIGLEKARQNFNKTHTYQIPTKNDNLSFFTRLYVNGMNYLKNKKGNND